MNSDDMLLIGRIVTPFGVRGEVKVMLISNRPDYFNTLKKVYLHDSFEEHAVKRFHPHKQGLYILRLGEVDDRDAAELLRGTELYITQSQAAPLETDEYFLHDLIGMAVQTQAGDDLGKVADVLETGANDVLIVKKIGQADILVPMIRAIIAEINQATQTITISSLDDIVPD